MGWIFVRRVKQRGWGFGKGIVVNRKVQRGLSLGEGGIAGRGRGQRGRSVFLGWMEADCQG